MDVARDVVAAAGLAAGGTHGGSVAGRSTLEQGRERAKGSDLCPELQMAILRDAYGAMRLGVHIREAISDRLKSLGIGHYPSNLPENQWSPVRLYRLGSPVAKLITAALYPSEAHDEELRTAAGGDAAAVLEKVRELVCD